LLGNERSNLLFLVLPFRFQEEIHYRRQSICVQVEVCARCFLLLFFPLKTHFRGQSDFDSLLPRESGNNTCAHFSSEVQNDLTDERHASTIQINSHQRISFMRRACEKSAAGEFRSERLSTPEGSRQKKGGGGVTIVLCEFLPQTASSWSSYKTTHGRYNIEIYHRGWVFFRQLWVHNQNTFSQLNLKKIEKYF